MTIKSSRTCILEKIFLYFKMIFYAFKPFIFIMLLHYLSSRIFIISQAALATDVPGPKMAATPAL